MTPWCAPHSRCFHWNGKRQWQRWSSVWVVVAHGNLSPSSSLGECQSIAQKGVCAIDARNSQLENGSNAAKKKPVFALLGCQQMSVSTLLREILWGWPMNLHFCRARHNPEPRSEVWWWNLRWSFGGENASDNFPQQKKLENLLPNFAGSSPPISPKTSPTSLWKSLVLTIPGISPVSRGS